MTLIARSLDAIVGYSSFFWLRNSGKLVRDTDFDRIVQLDGATLTSSSSKASALCRKHLGLLSKLGEKPLLKREIRFVPSSFVVHGIAGTRLRTFDEVDNERLHNSPSRCATR